VKKLAESLKCLVAKNHMKKRRAHRAKGSEMGKTFTGQQDRDSIRITILIRNAGRSGRSAAGSFDPQSILRTPLFPFVSL
jgi:hypothetical protein